MASCIIVGNFCVDGAVGKEWRGSDDVVVVGILTKGVSVQNVSAGGCWGSERFVHCSVEREEQLKP